jgi:Ca-activated chloride channel family protein
VESVVKHVLTGAALLALPLLASAQATSDAVAPTFRAGTELVALAVTVVDETRRHLGGLLASDFVVLEDGIEQPVSYFAASATPLDVLVLVDASASMGNKMPVVREAVRGLTRSLRPEDRAAIIEFHETIVERQAMTGDRGAIDRAVGQLDPQGGTAFYNALYVSLSQLAPDRVREEVRRQAVVVLSDGDDTASLIGYEDVLEKAQRTGVAIYSVTLETPTLTRGVHRLVGTAAPPPRGEYAMRMLSRETGGVAFTLSQLEELPAVYKVIGEELGRQYVLGYVPENTRHDGEWRSVLVRLPTHPDAHVRLRTGYYAEGPSLARIRLPLAQQ